MRYILRCAAAVSFVSALAGPALALPEVSTLGAFGDWSLVGDSGTPRQLCFVTAAVQETEPKGLNRGPARIYVSAWPKDGIRSEVSILFGFAVNRAAAVTVTIGTASFKMFAKDERAFVEDLTDELKLLDAMKKGSRMSIQATSERGTSIKDSYSLVGFGQAFQQLAGNCS